MQKIIYLYGPSCAGKSTIACEILKSEELSHVHYDILKWKIPNYSRDNPDHRLQIQEQMISLIDQKFAVGDSLLIEGLGLELFDQVKKFLTSPRRYFWNSMKNILANQNLELRLIRPTIL